MTTCFSLHGLNSLLEVCFRAPWVAQMVNNLPAMQETQVQSLGQEEWLPTPVFLPGEFQGQRSLVTQSMGSHRVRHD